MKQVFLSTTTEFKEIETLEPGSLDQPCEPFPK